MKLFLLLFNCTQYSACSASRVSKIESIRIAPWKGVPGLVDANQLSDSDLAALKSIKVTTDEDGNKTVTLQLWDKQPALSRLGETKKLWGSREDTAPDQQNFVQFFLEAVKSGALQQEAERRGLVPRSTIEVEGKPQG
jgi:hypothetical protein